MTAPKTLEEKAREWDKQWCLDHQDKPWRGQEPLCGCSACTSRRASLAALLASERAELKAEALRVVGIDVCGGGCYHSECARARKIRARLEAL